MVAENALAPMNVGCLHGSRIEDGLRPGPLELGDLSKWRIALGASSERRIPNRIHGAVRGRRGSSEFSRRIGARTVQGTSKNGDFGALLRVALQSVHREAVEP